MAVSPGTSRSSAPVPAIPALLTRKAVARLRAADLVLVRRARRRADPPVRAARAALLRRQARRPARADAGRRFNALMIRAARRGRRVVRLKGGDPFVFGRGGEEALALRRPACRSTSCPGVTSAMAAPALAGIPVTHRGLASAFLVVSGHDEEAFASAIARRRAERRHARRADGHGRTVARSAGRLIAARLVARHAGGRRSSTRRRRRSRCGAGTLGRPGGGRGGARRATAPAPS